MMLPAFLARLLGFATPPLVAQRASEPGQLLIEADNYLLDKQLSGTVQGLSLRELPTPPRLFFVVEIGEPTTLAQVAQFIATCPPEFEITYFDQFHPQLSDPGAYVRVQKTATNGLLRKLANHGWSGDWNATTAAELAAHIFKNRAFQAGNFRIYRKLSEAAANRK